MYSCNRQINLEPGTTHAATYRKVGSMHTSTARRASIPGISTCERHKHTQARGCALEVQHNCTQRSIPTRPDAKQIRAHESKKYFSERSIWSDLARAFRLDTIDQRGAKAAMSEVRSK
eukprot:1089439-Pleurochrysis_carterae.AAC.1